jgi:predicted phage terminase large subunit-like protein
MKQQDKQALARYRERLNQIKSGSEIPVNETREEQRLRIERAKKDPRFLIKTYFKHYCDSETPWFHVALMMLVLRFKLIRALVRWGRGLAKSVVCDVFIPIFLWINGEDVYLVIVGNTLDKAKILLSDVQAEFEANQLLIHDFGEQKLEGSWTDEEFCTRDNRFLGKALGMGQSPRGLRKGKKRPNIIVCDDLEDKDTSRNPKRQDDVVNWIERDLLPCMDGDTRRYLHPNNDPWPRSIQNLLQLRHPKWKVHEVKAYDPITYEAAWKEKYDNNYYKTVEEDLGVLAARAEYNHEKHTEGKIFTDEMIQWAKPPRIDHFKIIVGFWDVAFSGRSDYNAVKVWGLHGRNFWHLKAFVKQCKMADAIRFMYDYETELPPGVIVHWKVESQFWNDPMKDALHKVAQEKGRHLNIVVVERPRANKYDRILTMHPYYQNGRIYYNEREVANNDMQQGIAQLKGIEPGYKTHDDAPDADEQAINQLSEYVKKDNFKPMITDIEHFRSYSRNRF